MSHNIDMIMYINLNRRTDRRELIEEELNRYELRYEGFEAFDMPSFGAYGCLLSHLNVLKTARDRRYKNVLILEDDFTFIVSKDEFEDNLNKFFNSDIGSNYNVCMLSYNLHEHIKLDNMVVSRVLFAQTASGYIVNSNYYDKLIRLYEWALPLLLQTGAHWLYANDIVWRELQKADNWYYFKTRIGKQRAGYSDNSNCYNDYNC